MIKTKTGECIGCGNNRPLTAGRCQSCYWPYRRSLNAQKPKNKQKTATKAIIGIYMANQTLTFPEFCEESGQRLPTSPAWLRRCCMAHILPKREDHGFPSVAIHPKNMIFLHPDIHTNMDNLGEKYIMKMKSLPIMRQRVKELIPHMTPAEINRIPHYFL